jgi:hypothetical protein
MSSISEQADLLHSSLFKKKNEEAIYDLITKTSLSDRISISRYYRGAYNSSLFSDIQSKIGGDYGYLAAQMFLSPIEFCLHHLKLGLKKDFETVLEILTSKTNEELKVIEKVYKLDTGNDLRNDILKEYKGVIGKNLVLMFDTPRSNNSRLRKNECERLAKLLVEKDPKLWVEDEKIFKDIFLMKSPEELVLIARYYFNITGNNLAEVADKKLKDKNQLLIKEILFNNIMPHELFAEKIYSSMKGIGTNEEKLSRALVSRCEIDMPLIREMYEYKYKTPMKEDIIGDNSGMYQKLCVYLAEK